MMVGTTMRLCGPRRWRRRRRREGHRVITGVGSDAARALQPTEASAGRASSASSAASSSAAEGSECRKRKTYCTQEEIEAKRRRAQEPARKAHRQQHRWRRIASGGTTCSSYCRCRRPTAAATAAAATAAASDARRDNTPNQKRIYCGSELKQSAAPPYLWECVNSDSSSECQHRRRDRHPHFLDLELEHIQDAWLASGLGNGNGAGDVGVGSGPRPSSFRVVLAYVSLNHEGCLENGKGADAEETARAAVLTTLCESGAFWQNVDAAVHAAISATARGAAGAAGVGAASGPFRPLPPRVVLGRCCRSRAVLQPAPGGRACLDWFSGGGVPTYA